MSDKGREVGAKWTCAYCDAKLDEPHEHHMGCPPPGCPRAAFEPPTPAPEAVIEHAPNCRSQPGRIQGSAGCTCRPTPPTPAGEEAQRLHRADSLLRDVAASRGINCTEGHPEPCDCVGDAIREYLSAPAAPGLPPAPDEADGGKAQTLEGSQSELLNCLRWLYDFTVRQAGCTLPGGHGGIQAALRRGEEVARRKPSPADGGKAVDQAGIDGREIARLRDLLRHQDHGLCCAHLVCHRCNKDARQVAMLEPCEHKAAGAANSPADGAEGRRADISRWFYALKHEHVNGEVIPCATHRDTEKILRKFEIADKAATENGRAYGLAISRAEAAESALADARAEIEALRALDSSTSPCGHNACFAFTEDGGKNIVCLKCKSDSAANALADALVVLKAAKFQPRECCAARHPYLSAADIRDDEALAAFARLKEGGRA